MPFLAVLGTFTTMKPVAERTLSRSTPGLAPAGTLAITTSLIGSTGSNTERITAGAEKRRSIFWPPTPGPSYVHLPRSLYSRLPRA